MAKLSPYSSDAMFYDYRVRLANGVTATVCARDREEAAALVKGILGRLGGAGARIAAILLLRKREPGLSPHPIAASDLRRFVANRVAARRPRYKPAPYSVRYQRKSGPFAQVRRRK